MSILKVDTINEKTSGNGVQIAGHVVQVVRRDPTAAAITRFSGTSASYANTSGSDVEDLTIHYLDSPSSTSSVTYSLMADAAGQGMAVGGRMSSSTANQISSITLMEIAQ